MFRARAISVAAGVCLVSPVFSQATGKVDFERDVEPIFRQNCIGCHGPKIQNGGMRVDRRSSVLKADAHRVAPQSIEYSFLYQRLIGPDFGPRMPPAGQLPPEQVRIVKAWIEQGAEWPDTLANEAELPPLNPKAVSLVEALRTANREAFEKILAEIQSCSTRADRKVPRRSCTPSFIPTRQPWSG